MSMTMFPNSGNPTLTEGMDDRTFPRGPATGEGPYGSFNDDEKGDKGDIEDPLRSLSLNDMDHPPKYATMVEDLYSPVETQHILDDAYVRATLIMNPILTRAIRDRLTVGQFNEQVGFWADDLLETCVYESITDRGNTPYDIKALTPVGLVSFLDHFMAQQRGRVAQVEELLKEAFQDYWASKNQTA